MGRLYDGAVVRHLISIVVVVVLVAHPMVHVQRSRDSLTFAISRFLSKYVPSGPPPPPIYSTSTHLQKDTLRVSGKVGGGFSRTLFSCLPSILVLVQGFFLMQLISFFLPIVLHILAKISLYYLQLHFSMTFLPIFTTPAQLKDNDSIALYSTLCTHFCHDRHRSRVKC
jgi:hypothetical protein